MKNSLRYLIIGLLGCSSPALFDVSADLEVSAGVQIHATAEFHAPLAPHGVWVDVGPYGRCWRPAHVAVAWRPYGEGHWVWTDVGWYWVSDEPWAWACYHYGSWVNDANFGWVWVPGIEWAPAWVTWRFGGGYCGWAPLAPRGVIVAPPAFVFVEVHRFHEAVKPSTIIVNNTTVIKATTEVSGLKRESRSLAGSGPQKVVINEGPRIDMVQNATGRRIEPVSVREIARKTPAPEVIVKERGPGPSERPSLSPSGPNQDFGKPGGRQPRTDPRTDRGGGRGHGRDRDK